MGKLFCHSSLRRYPAHATHRSAGDDALLPKLDPLGKRHFLRVVDRYSLTSHVRLPGIRS